jgi:hypothetical protein
MWSMASQESTFALDDEQLQATGRQFVSGKASSVSGFGQYAFGVSLDDIAGWAS